MAKPSNSPSPALLTTLGVVSGLLLAFEGFVAWVWITTANQTPNGNNGDAGFFVLILAVLLMVVLPIPTLVNLVALLRWLRRRTAAPLSPTQKFLIGLMALQVVAALGFVAVEFGPWLWGLVGLL
ncbi:MAG TPA: hypothetical protein VI322_00285 [Candidatus Saccharimonadia bacterium]